MSGPLKDEAAVEATVRDAMLDLRRYEPRYSVERGTMLRENFYVEITWSRNNGARWELEGRMRGKLQTCADLDAFLFDARRMMDAP